MISKPKKTLIIGSSVCDVIIRVHKIPQSSEDENILSQMFSIGGCAYNVASMFHYYHLSYTLFSPVGTGIYGEFVKKHFLNHHIPLTIETDHKNGCCYCLVDDSGERTFICEHGAEYFYQKEWFDALEANKYEQVYICGLEIEETTGDMIIDFLEQHPHFQIFFAPGPRILYINPHKMKRLFQLHPILHLNQNEILSYTKQDNLKQAAIALYKETQQKIIVTLGEQGCYFFDGHQEIYVEAKKTTPVDTIGACDSHIRTIMAQLILGKSWLDCLHEANSISSLVVSKTGATLIS